MKSRILKLTSLGLFTVAITICAPFARADTVTFQCVGDNNLGTCQEANPAAPNVTFPGPTLDISWYGQKFAIGFTDSSWLASNSYDWLASNGGFIIGNASAGGLSVSVFGINTNLPSGVGLSEFGTLAFGTGTGPVGAPEPGTLALLFLGLAGLGFMRKRKTS
jgi:PEP-CTERM motif